MSVEKEEEKMKRDKLIRLAKQLVHEIRKLEELLGMVTDGPSGLFSAWPSGMPSGTNVRDAAMLQRTDVNEAMDRLDALYEKLDILMGVIGQGRNAA